MDAKKIIIELTKHANAKNVEGMKRFGIRGKNILGGPGLPALRKMAREIIKQEKTDRHKIAVELWNSNIHEARILAGFVDDPAKVSRMQMEEWANDFDSWDICDTICSNLFDKTPHALEKIGEWAKRKEEFVKRAGFVLMAALAVHDKKANDKMFVRFLPIIARESTDERNFVKKAVNWALRQIGKRNPFLRKEAIKKAKSILEKDSNASRWIARDALRELERKH